MAYTISNLFVTKKYMTAKTPAQKKAEAEAKKAAEQAEADRRAALSQEERDAEDAEAAAKADEAAKAKKTAKTVVSVQFHGGVREFSLAIHGEDFESVAEEFATTHKGTIL